MNKKNKVINLSILGATALTSMTIIAPIVTSCSSNNETPTTGTITQQDVDNFVNQTANQFNDTNAWTLKKGMALLNKNDANWDAAKTQSYNSVTSTLTSYFKEKWKTDVNVTTDNPDSNSPIFTISVSLTESNNDALNILYGKDWKAFISSFPREAQDSIKSIDVKIDATADVLDGNTTALLKFKLNEVIVSDKNSSLEKITGKATDSNINNVTMYMVCDTNATPVEGSQFETQLKDFIDLSDAKLSAIDDLLKPWLLDEYNTEGQEINKLTSYDQKFEELKDKFKSLGITISKINRTTFDMLSNTNGIDGSGYGYENEGRSAKKTVSVQFVFSGKPIVLLDDNSKYSLNDNSLISPYFKSSLACSQYDFTNDQLTNLKNVLTDFAKTNIKYRIKNKHLFELVTKNDLLSKINDVFKKTDGWFKTSGISIWGGGGDVTDSFNESGQIQFQITPGTIWDKQDTKDPTNLTYDFSANPNLGFGFHEYQSRNYLTPWIDTGMLEAINISSADAQKIYEIMVSFSQTIDKRYPTTDELKKLSNYNSTIDELNKIFTNYNLKVSCINLCGETSTGYTIEGNQSKLNWGLSFEADPIKLTINNASESNNIKIAYSSGAIQLKGSSLTSIPTVTLDQNQLNKINNILITYSKKITSFSPSGAPIKITAANFSNANDYNNFINELSSVLGPNFKATKILVDRITNTTDKKINIAGYRIFFGGANVATSGNDNPINVYNYSDEYGTGLITNSAKAGPYPTNANNLENGNGVLVLTQKLANAIAKVLKENAPNIDLTNIKEKEIVLTSKELSNIDQLKNDVANASDNGITPNNIIFKATDIEKKDSTINFNFRIEFKTISYIIFGADKKDPIGISVMNWQEGDSRLPYMYYKYSK